VSSWCSDGWDVMGPLFVVYGAKTPLRRRELGHR
jgi:hypothetical protein